MLSDDQRSTLTVLFDALDATGDGLITRADTIARADQVSAGLALDEDSAAHRDLHAAYGRAWDEVVRGAGADPDGAVELEEFLATMDRGMVADPDYLERAILVITGACFDAADANDDGMIDVEEYTRLITCVDPSREEVARSGFALLDADGSGLVSREELVGTLRAACSGAPASAELGGSIVR